MKAIEGFGSAVIALGLAAGAALAPAVALADRTYDEEDRIAHDCGKDGNAVVNVAGASAMFTGACTRIVINGAENKVKIASVKSLKVNGAGNTIHADHVEDISATGVGNAITYKKRVTGKTSVKSPKLNNKISEVR